CRHQQRRQRPHLRNRRLRRSRRHLRNHARPDRSLRKIQILLTTQPPPHAGDSVSFLWVHSVNQALTVGITYGISFLSCSAPNAEPNTALDLPAALTATSIWFTKFLHRVPVCGSRSATRRRCFQPSETCTKKAAERFSGGPRTGTT